MKKARIQTAFLALANLFLLASFLFSCQKETVLPAQDISSMLKAFKIIPGVNFIPVQTNAPTLSTANDRSEMQEFPYSDGNCKVQFKVRKFDPNIPFEGGDGPPCKHTGILFSGYSQPNGQGTLLFSVNLPVTGDWQQFSIPCSAYIGFVIQQTQISGDGACLFKLHIADYGWNRNIGTQVNIPYNQWRPLITGRFAPKDPLTPQGILEYDEYLCDSWCTWSVPVSFRENDPLYISVALRCFYGPNAVPFNSIFPDPRVIKSHPLFDTHSKMLFFYPITPETNHPYRTEAADIGPPDNQAQITYDVRGADQQGVGPFVGWGVAPYSLITTGKCNVGH